MLHRLRRALTPTRDERGQGSLENVGVIVLAAILVAATTGTIVQASPQLRAEVSYRICQILSVAGGGGCEAPGSVPSAEDRVPDEPCVVGSQQGSVSVTGSFVVSVTAGKELLVEQLSDGTFRVSEVDLGSVGVGVGPGLDISVTIDGKKYGAVATASADALLAGKTGRTWYADDESSVQDIMNGLVAEEALDQVAPELPGPKDVPLINQIPGLGDLGGPPNPTRELIEAFIGDLPDPDETFVEGGIEGNAGAAISGITAGAGAQGGLGVYLGSKRTPDGWVAYYRGEIKGSTFATLGADDASASGKMEAIYAVNLGQDGVPESVTLTAGLTYAAETGSLTTNTDDQTYVETQATVPLTGDPAQDAATMAVLTGNPFATQAFVEAAQERGQITQSSYSQDPNTYGLTVGGELLGDYGGGITADLTNRSLTDSSYWDGTAMVSRPDC